MTDLKKYRIPNSKFEIGLGSYQPSNFLPD